MSVRSTSLVIVNDGDLRDGGRRGVAGRVGLVGVDRGGVDQIGAGVDVGLGGGVGGGVDPGFAETAAAPGARAAESR